MFDITGSVALVTGSSRGIGRALAAGLLQAGCTVVVNGRDVDAVLRTRDELRLLVGDGPGRVAAAPFDVTDPPAVRAAVAGIETDVGPLDILVNNTGVQSRAPFTEVTDEDWRRVVDTNLTGAFLVGREVARRMVPRGRGRIINIASLQSEVTRPGITPYAATKGAVKMLTKGMCADLAGSGIGVNAIGPGYFDTELTAPLVADEEFSAWVRRRTPAGRWGRVEELVGALVFLSSPAAAFVHGQVLYVDGGMSAVL
jgi:gluconate 5-dehydrogenase